MRRIVILVGLVLAAIGCATWALGGLAVVQAALTDAQRDAQNGLAHAVRAIRAGSPGALAGLLAGTFGYGVLHAAGPGHGKMLIGGYAMARRVRAGPVILLALGASLAQAAVAVGLVYGAVAVLHWTREAVVAASERVMAPVGTAMVLVLGLWLVQRSLRRLVRAAIPALPVKMPDAVPDLRGKVGHAHRHDQAPDDDCGHAHGPSLADIAGVTSLRDALWLIAAVAMRPCTGALFLLIMTWNLGIGGAGVAGVFVMAIGTAVVTIGAAVLAIWAREHALAGFSMGRVGQVLAGLELAAGLVIALVAAARLQPFL